ncbi:MAG: GGDEF domain-containing protein, partial [Coriobacteriales bacterium]|nr:GGDEF domain-containing protein [Coriobacteriales bacterium]
NVYSRRYFYAFFDEMKIKPECSGENMAILMMDIDYFKEINDQHGHLAGDAALHRLAGTLRERFRSSDLICRYGGDEFCVLLRADSDDAYRIAEGCRSDLEEATIRHDGQEFSITISIGMATFDPERHHSPESLLSDADAALYAAKNSKRNTVTRFCDMEHAI